jgi:hypothetical protein
VINTNLSSQGVNRNNSFVAIFKDTLFSQIDTNVKALVIDIVEKEIRLIIAKDSLITLASGRDTIWTFDTTVNNRRCYGTVYSGPVLKAVVKKHYTDNLINLYSPADVKISRLFNGLFIYISENSNWSLNLKTE